MPAVREKKTTVALAGALMAAIMLCTSCASSAQNQSDGVSKAEYYAAAQAAADCLSKKGFEAEEPEEDYAGGYTIGVGSEIGDDEGTAAGVAALDKCWAKYAAPVEKKYIEGLALSGEAWEADYREFVSCLDKAGVTGVKVGDEEGVVGEAIGDNFEGVMCIQAHLYKLFRNGAGE